MEQASNPLIIHKIKNLNTCDIANLSLMFVQEFSLWESIQRVKYVEFVKAVDDLKLVIEEGDNEKCAE